MKKAIIITIVIALIIFVSVFIYFVTGVSSTYAPIRKYEYAGNINQFITGIRNYTSTDSTAQLKITDTTGNKENGYAIYMNIEIKVNQDSIEYGLKCDEHSDGKTILSLVEAYNKTRITGGYSKEAKGGEPLVSNFEDNFLTPLRNSQKLKITPL